MADLLFLAITVAFFAVTVAVVRLCDRIIGPDSEQLVAEPAPLEAVPVEPLPVESAR